MAWLGIVMVCAIHFSNNCNQKIAWMDPPYRLSIAYIYNTMPQKAFEFLRHYIHFTDNEKKRDKNHPDYNPLYKVKNVLDKMMDGMRKAWVAREGVMIDESMVKYCGQAVALIQYLPKKPIKNGIKVLALCCAYTAVLLGFEFDIGGNKTNNSAIGVVRWLITGAQGRAPSTQYWQLVHLSFACKSTLWWIWLAFLWHRDINRQDTMNWQRSSF